MNQKIIQLIKILLKIILLKIIKWQNNYFHSKVLQIKRKFNYIQKKKRLNKLKQDKNWLYKNKNNKKTKNKKNNI